MDADSDRSRAPRLMSNFDPFDAASYTKGGAHAAWRAQRRTEPVRKDVAPNGTECWSFFRYAECHTILREATAFSSTSGAVLTCVGAPDPAGGQALALTDPPQHTALRRPSTRAVGPAAVRTHEAEIRVRVRRLLRPMLAGGVHDLATTLRQLPMIAAGPLLGIPEEHWDTAVEAALATIAPGDPSHRDGDEDETVLRASSRLFGSIRASLTTALSRPETLIGALSATTVDGTALTRRRIMLNVHSALVGGNTATVNVALHLLLHLARTPDLWRAVVDDRSVIPGLVDEAARWTTPAQQLVRRATTDLELGGVRLRAGDWVVAWIASANRDESVFPSPDRFDPRRAPNPHLAFGLGPHFCVGAAAARTLLAALVDELADSGVRFALVGPPRHLVSAVVNGVASLPMRFTP
ncbi:cytochrome P450 [Micromonospora echinospora]